MKKRVRDELDQARHEFGSLLKDGFTIKDDFMVDLLFDIEQKKEQKELEKERARVVAPAPPYIKDVVWHDSEQKTPRVGGKNLERRDFAMFVGSDGEATYRAIMGNIKWKKSPLEPWRVTAIHIMAWELADSRQTFPKPSWLDLQAYAPKRVRTIQEETEDFVVGERIITMDEPPKKKKKPTKRDLLDAKYAELIKMLK